MKTLIVFASSHGTTEKVALQLAKSLSGHDVTVTNVKKVRGFDLQVFDCVIIGGSIHAGKVQKEITGFIQSNISLLMNIRLGLFVCGMDPDPNKQQSELDGAYPEVVRKHAVAVAFLGGEFLFEKMNFLEKMIIKKIAKTDKNVSALRYDTIDKFIQHLQH